jgi:hypothetical protein
MEDGEEGSVNGPAGNSQTGDLVIRMSTWRAVALLLVCGALLAILILGAFGSDDGLLGLACLGPLVALITVRMALDVINTRLVLSQSEMALIDWRGRRRSLPRASITGVWGATLPARPASSDVGMVLNSKLPVVVVTGSGQVPPILLSPARFPAAEIKAFWEHLGRTPKDVGELTNRELFARFPGMGRTGGQMLLGWLGWTLAYVVIAVVLLLLIRLVRIRTMGTAG